MSQRKTPYIIIFVVLLLLFAAARNKAGAGGLAERAQGMEATVILALDRVAFPAVTYGVQGG